MIFVTFQARGAAAALVCFSSVSGEAKPTAEQCVQAQIGGGAQVS